MKMSQILKSENLALLELRTEKIRQVLRRCLAVSTYVPKDGQVRELFISPLSLIDRSCHCAQRFAVHVVSGLQYSVKGAPNAKSVPTALEAQLYLHAMRLICREVGTKKINNVRNALNSAMAGMAIQTVQKSSTHSQNLVRLGP